MKGRLTERTNRMLVGFFANLLVLLAAASWSAVGEEQPLFVFAAIGDPHVSVAGNADRNYIKAGDKSPKLLANCVRDLNAHVPRVDFVVLLGDIANEGRKSEYDLARKSMEGLACPFYAVVGNHDNFQCDAKAAWRNFAGRDPTTYAFDWLGLHLVVIDCTNDPYTVDGVDCTQAVRDWVERDLALNSAKPVILFSHYNMLAKAWDAKFDTTRHYAEYKGMNEMRQMLERAGNVVAVVNGHVHANRVEVRGGIHYIDVGAILVGRPSIRYFYVYGDRIEVTYAYISDGKLLDHVVALGQQCLACFDREEVVDFADGSEADKEFTIPLGAITRPTSR